MARFLQRCYPSFSEATYLAALVGIKDDLEQVINYCGELQKQIDANYRGYYLWEALANAAAISYARCFGNGVRPPLSASVLCEAPEDIQATHRFIMDLRNKHIAHSVNVFEENRVIANILVEDLVPKQVESIEVESRRLMAISDAEVHAVHAAAAWCLAKVEALIEEERDAVLLKFRERPLETFLALKEEPFPKFLAEGAVKKIRKQQ